MPELNLNVTMIGPRGCGKTTVLSVMLGEITSFINTLNGDKKVREHCNPKLGVTDFASKTLLNVYRDVQGVAKNIAAGAIDVDVVPHSGRRNTYKIDLSVCGVNTTVSFHDFPGGYFIPENHENIEPKELEGCKQAFEQADVILLCLDVPTQISFPIEEEEEMFNSYTQYITKFIKESLSKDSPNGIRKTVIILPMKCEHAILDTVNNKYGGYNQTINDEKNKKLFEHVKALYKNLFTHLKGDDKTSSFYLPVITMGCAKAMGVKYNAQNGSLKIGFEPVVEGELFHKQINCSSLLALCLLSAQKLIKQKYIKEKATVWEKIKDYFGGKVAIDWFFYELCRQCSMCQVLFDDFLRMMQEDKVEYNDLSDEQRQKYDELKKDAAKEKFNGCRRIKITGRMNEI